MIKGAVDLVPGPRRLVRSPRLRLTPARKRRDRSNDLTIRIRALLPALFSNGLSVRDLYEIAKREALVAALPACSHATGRPNQSLLSAVTGLTRPEIRSLLKESGTNAHDLVAISSSRSIRVVREWLTLETGNPRRARLRIRGNSASFQNLVRRFAGDVPVIAMQKELVRLGWVRVHTKSGEIELLPKKVRGQFARII